ncbi:MAG: HAMP domain-containing histidine kinase [Chloroflexi bacterium]|nr:HAMP domain-containing histidine kinase [Chloroflexota bacterium]
MKRQSIRWQLPISYAAIALLSALALGSVLFLVLRSYYVQREYEYLQGNANAINSVVMQMVENQMPLAAIQAHLDTYSFLAQARVRYLDAAGNVLADSGIPAMRNLLTISARPGESAPQTPARATPSALADYDQGETTHYAASYNPGILGQESASNTYDDFGAAEEAIEYRNYPTFSADLSIPIELPPDSTQPNVEYYTPVISLNFIRVDSDNQQTNADRSAADNYAEAGFASVLPATGTLYGFDLSADRTTDGQRSDQLFTETVLDSAGNTIGYLELSQGPAYGGKIISHVARGLAIAGALAVGLAALVGWRISRRISVPLLALTTVTKQMAAGDLSARANIQRQDELGLLSTSFNHMARQVEETIKALRRFVADAAHELHTPLTAARTNLELAADEGDARTRLTYLERAATQLQRLESLTDGLLNLSRIEAGEAKTAHKELSLTVLLQELSEPYASRSEQVGVNFELALPQEAVRVVGSPAQLRCAISNLLDNAIKFTPAGETVSLKLCEQKHFVEVEVRDTGIGIPEDEAALIFSRFHRCRNAANYPGSGLGLAIVKGIADSHGGQISIRPVARGASFLLRLPLP